MSDARQYTSSEFLTLIKNNLKSDEKNAITINSLLGHIENCIALLTKLEEAFKEGNSGIASRVKIQQELLMIHQLPINELNDKNKKQIHILLKYLPNYIETIEKKLNNKLQQGIKAEDFLETDMSNPTQAIFFKMLTKDDERENKLKPIIDDLVYKVFVKMQNIETHVALESSVLDNTMRQLREYIVKLTQHLEHTTDENKQLLEQIILMAHNYKASIDEKLKNQEIKILKFTIEKYPIDTKSVINSPSVTSGLGNQLRQHGLLSPSASPNPLSPVISPSPSTEATAEPDPISNQDVSPKK